ncbi:hypothetical protein GCM10009750_28850 [Agromyces salentinus]|uniref:Protein-glutamine gamma-glutamyltransferase-like C-terminal domain-containing protein n=2 Tax=Agromyces salentinus TaxID=269421 RepID=A0ABP4Z4L8_9MICO
MAVATAVAARVRAEPLDPDAPAAREWLKDELSNARYRAGEPNAFDRAMQAVRDWFLGLLDGAGAVSAEVVALLVVIGVIVLVVIGVLVFGVPRLRRRRRPEPASFEDDRRDAPVIRRAAAAAAAGGDWPLAIEERFRALVRDLVVRELVQVHPGSTARALADAAGAPFPELSEPLARAATEFDAVRYLGRSGDAAAYARIAALDDELQTTRPAPVGAPAGDLTDRRLATGAGR